LKRKSIHSRYQKRSSSEKVFLKELQKDDSVHLESLSEMSNSRFFSLRPHCLALLNVKPGQKSDFKKSDFKNPTSKNPTSKNPTSKYPTSKNPTSKNPTAKKNRLQNIRMQNTRLQNIQLQNIQMQNTRLPLIQPLHCGAPDLDTHNLFK
jgi:hypothetical protein